MTAPPEHAVACSRHPRVGPAEPGSTLVRPDTCLERLGRLKGRASFKRRYRARTTQDSLGAFARRPARSGPARHRMDFGWHPDRKRRWLRRRSLSSSGNAAPPGESPTTARSAARSAVRVGARRAGGEVVRVTARPGDDIVVVRIANGPSALSASRARARPDARADGRDRRPRVAPSRLRDGEVVVPAQLELARSRGCGGNARRHARLDVGGALIETFEIMTGLSKDEGGGPGHRGR